MSIFSESNQLKDIPFIWNEDADKLAKLKIFTTRDLIRHVNFNEGICGLSQILHIPKEQLQDYYQHSQMHQRKRNIRFGARWLSVIMLPLISIGTAYWAFDQRPMLSECQQEYASLYADFNASADNLGPRLAVYDDYIPFLGNAYQPDPSVEFKGCQPEFGEQAVIANILQLKAAWHDSLALSAIKRSDFVTFKEQSGIAGSLLNILKTQPSHRQSATANNVGAVALQKQAIAAQQHSPENDSDQVVQIFRTANKRFIQANRNAFYESTAETLSESGWQVHSGAEFDSAILREAVDWGNSIFAMLKNISDTQNDISQQLMLLEVKLSDQLSSTNVQEENSNLELLSEVQQQEEIFQIQGCRKDNLSIFIKELKPFANNPKYLGEVINGYMYYSIDNKQLVANVEGSNSNLKRKIVKLLNEHKIEPLSPMGICKVQVTICDGSCS